MNKTAFRSVVPAVVLGMVLGAGALPGCGKSNPAPGKKIDVVVAPPTPGAKLAGQKLPGVGDLKIGEELELPFILWGGDVATFHANGGLETRPGTIFQKQGLRFKLVRGDDFPTQVKKYVEGTSPFLRGTMSMLGQVSEELGGDARTQPVVFLQLTWSAGDHLVARGNLRMLDDLRGKTIALQKRGPHVGMLHDILRTARLSRSDIKVVETEDVTGDKGPAARFRKDPTIDACFAISPDMTDLTGGPDKTGDGTKDTVKDAHVLISTAHMSRSIADVYACRKDFYDTHRDLVEKFSAAYLKACEELIAMKKDKGAPYKAVLKLTQDIYGKSDIKTEDDAAGLIDDAAFVGLPGNISFFTDRGNLSGFEAKQRAALDTAFAEGDIKQKFEFIKGDMNYDKIKNLGQLTGKPLPDNRFSPNLKFLPQDTIYFFTINFMPDKFDFPEATYGQDFQRALEMASLFGKAVMVVRGHADPAARMLDQFVNDGLVLGVLRQESSGGQRSFYLKKDGTKLDLANLRQIVDVIAKEHMTGSKMTTDYLQKLSERRAEAVRGSVESFAKSKDLRLDKSQVRFQGVGVLEPAVARLNATPDEMARNRRVEFRIIRVRLEEFSPEDIDY